MDRGLGRRILVLGVAFAAFGANAGPAQAAITLGYLPGDDLEPSECKSETGFTDSFQVSTEKPGISYRVPAAGGVITSWSTSATDGLLREKLRVFDVNGDGTLTPRAESDAHAVPPGTYTFDTHIPVVGGKVIGLSYKNEGTGCAYDGEPSDVSQYTLIGQSSPLGVPEPTRGDDPGSVVNISAVLEPDSDKDLLGDESEDQCPSDAADEADCLVHTPSITAHPKKRSRSARANFRFKSDERATFKCAIDGDRLGTCRSPEQFLDLDQGRHKFTLEATDKAGNTSEAKLFRWRVVN